MNAQNVLDMYEDRLAAFRLAESPDTSPYAHIYMHLYNSSPPRAEYGDLHAHIFDDRFMSRGKPNAVTTTTDESASTKAVAKERKGCGQKWWWWVIVVAIVSLVVGVVALCVLTGIKRKHSAREGIDDLIAVRSRVVPKISRQLVIKNG